MALVKIVGGFLGLWVIFYLVVYLTYMSPDDSKVSKASEKIDENGVRERNLKLNILDTPFAHHPDVDQDSPNREQIYDGSEGEYHDFFEPAVGTNPFLTDTCTFRTQQAREILSTHFETAKNNVGIVIPARNENKNELLKTVESIIKNSGSELKKIIVVDDFSTAAIESWPEWRSYYAAADTRFGGSNGNVLQISRLHHRNGVAKAKAFGAEQLRMAEIDVLVFLDAHVIVSKDWLIPLTTELHKHPKSLVYPAIDIIDGSNGDLIKGENAVGAFDWSMDFRWEILVPTKLSRMKARVPISAIDKDGHPINEDDVVSSPAAPGMFAINAKYYHDMGGFDTTLYPWGQENIELSIRVWLCGGSVLRQPCSRVAHTYRHVSEDVDVNNGVTQGQIDRNVLSVAELWLSPHQRETVYQSRFTNRIPYNVEMSLDARSLKDFLNVKILRDEKCQDFDWYLKEIYPGLEMDRKNVENTYRNYLSSDYLQIGLEPLLSQYKKERTEQIEPISSAQLLLLQNRENRPEETELKLRKMSAVPKVIRPKVDTPEEIHLKLVRDELQCVDMPKANINDALGPCEILLEKDPDTCKNDYGVMMFACPLSCDLCGEDGKICFDFYDKKCPEWKAEGMCESNSVEMEKKCRLTCGFCTKKQKKDIIVKKEIVGDVRDINKENLNIEELKVEDPHGLDHNSLPKVDKKVVSNPDLFLSDEAKAKIALVTTTKIANPYTAQDQYKKGLLPDPVGSLAGACYLNDKPHGKLLAHMDLMKIETVSTDLTPKKIPRIFCGIYTMESSHKENVQATRETWAKKCDGFVAFSTVDDDSIPAINILHEGVESYNNMWQKSRSIWKYIHAHYSDSFDFFLMGGDDMFYIIENLKHYLMTEEITSYVSSHEGTFLGRRFYPGDKVFNSGGAGYILDRKALNIMAPYLDSPKCYAHQVGFWEDVNIANCLRVSGEIEPYDTRDSLGRERFHPFTPGMHLDYRIPKVNPDWYPKYNPFLKEGYDCCSVESVSFHYCPADLTRELNNYFYHCHDKHKEY